VAQVQDIMDLYEREGLSLRQIARRLHVSRNTVRRVVDSPAHYLGVEPKKQRARPKTVLVPALTGRIDQILKDDQREPRKQRHTAHRIWERLLEEGFCCAESTIRRYVGQKKRGMREVFIPLEFGPGEDAQVDWGYGSVEIDGARVEVACFIGVLSWSRTPFIQVYHSASQESFLDGLASFFEFIGGVPARVWFDRLASAVSSNVFKGMVEQQKFGSFRTYYGFEAQFCNGGKANEKGRVENKVGSLRRSVLVPVPSGKCIHAINDHLLFKCRQKQSEQVPDGTESVAERLEIERRLLRKLPGQRYPCYRVTWTKPNRTSLVNVARNWYSVPPALRGTQLTVHLHSEWVEVYHEQRMVARHPRLFGEKHTMCELDHYLDGLCKKPGALPNAKPYRQAELPPSLRQFHQRMLQQHPEQANLEMVRVLLLARENGLDAISLAVEKVMHTGVFSSDAVRREIERQAPAPVDLQRYQVRRRSAAEFDALVAGGVNS